MTISPTDTPLPYQLRDYQIKAVNDLWDYFRHKSGNPCIVMPTASGKSIVIAAICKRAILEYPETRILMLTHVRELIEQNADKLSLPVSIYSAGLNSKEIGQITFAGIQSIHKRPEETGHIDLILVDECFVAGTKIKTTMGDKDIDLVRCGDVVYNQLGFGIVEAVSIKPATELYTLEFSDGTKITCTGNHQFFTEKGWREAKTLENGSYFFSPEAMCLLWENFYTLDKIQRRWEDKISLHREDMGKYEVLFNILCEEIRKSNDVQVCKRENAQDFNKNEAQANQKRREWEVASFAATSLASCFRGRMGSGSSNSDSYEALRNRLSNVLQDRHSKQGLNDRDRSRWFFSLLFGEEKEGQEENRFSYIKRLDNISSVKRESPEPVYNLQVSGHPSYFANGVLVHNCHLISHKDQGMYRTFISALKSINPKLKVIGFTATPYRLGHGLITDKPAVFDDLIEPVSIYELIKDGYLSPLTSKATKLTYDTSIVRKRGGEFIESELQKAVNTTTNNEAVVHEIISCSQGRSHWLIFCTGVKHSLKIRDLLLSHNITAATVTAKTPLPERDQIISGFKSGHITALTNTNVFTTGFDVPSVDLIALLRPTMSPGLYLQMVGRGMRIAPHKTDCLILDFAGNVYTHGPIGSVAPPVPYSGDGIAPAKICPSCYEIIHAAFRTCPICSYSFPPPKPKPLYLRDDDISSGYRTHNIQEWRWNVHLARSGNTVLRCAYYPKTLSATPIYEYFAILSTGYGGLKAMQRLKLITDRLGVHLNHESLDAFCIVMNSHTPPAQVVTQRKGKYQEIVDKIWSTP